MENFEERGIKRRGMMWQKRKVGELERNEREKEDKGEMELGVVMNIEGKMKKEGQVKKMVEIKREDMERVKELIM